MGPQTQKCSLVWHEFSLCQSLPMCATQNYCATWNPCYVECSCSLCVFLPITLPQGLVIAKGKDKCEQEKVNTKEFMRLLEKTHNTR
jgi:hypothetical protein